MSVAVTSGIGSPPASRREEGGGGRGWVKLAQARNDIDAHLLVGRLEEAGIETRAVPDRRAPGAWLYAGSNPWAPVAVMVRAFQLQDARVVLAEISLEHPHDQPHSRHGAPWRRPVLGGVAALLLGAILSALSIVQARW